LGAFFALFLVDFFLPSVTSTVQFPFLRKILQPPCNFAFLSAPIMNRKSTMDELARLEVDEFKSKPKRALHLLLDDIRSLNNIGSIFRTADAFRLVHIHLCGITAQPPHRDIQKTALGATESVDWSHHKSILDCIVDLKADGSRIFALEQTTESVDLRSFQCKATDSLALIVGNEVKGVSEDALAMCEGSLEIRQFGTKHSLNVAVSTGMAVYHLAGQIGFQD